MDVPALNSDEASERAASPRPMLSPIASSGGKPSQG
jgi:hypothetical protein